MNGLEQRRHGSVTERLSDRLDDLEPIVERLLANEAKLIADSVRHRDDWRAHDTRFMAVDAAIHQLRTQHRVCNAEDRLASLEIFRTCGTFWQRLRWLVVGG